jgi:hypothetical protein
MASKKKINFWGLSEGIIGLILSIYSIVQVIPQINAVVNDGLRNFYWIISILVIGLAFGVFLRTIYFTLFKNNWVNCENFPNEDRICFKVRELINDDNFVQEKSKKSFDRIEPIEDNLYQQFLNVILKFFILSRKNCIMTLPYDPYEQINNKKKNSTLENSLDSISKTIISKRDKTKVIALSNEDLEKFKENLVKDFKANKDGLKIKNYIDIHKKKINLFWLVNPAKAIDEFIIIDESVDISVSEGSKSIHVDFHKETIEKHKNEFDNISTTKKTTSEFFNNYILNKTMLSQLGINQNEEKQFRNLFCK